MALGLAIALGILLEDFGVALALPKGVGAVAMSKIGAIFQVLAGIFLSTIVGLSILHQRSEYLTSKLFVCEALAILSYVFPLADLFFASPVTFLMFSSLPPGTAIEAWRATAGVLNAIRILGMTRAMASLALAVRTKVRVNTLAPGLAAVVAQLTVVVGMAVVGSGIVVCMTFTGLPVDPHWRGMLYSLEAAVLESDTPLSPLVTPPWASALADASKDSGARLSALSMLGVRMIGSSSSSDDLQRVHSVVMTTQRPGTEALFAIDAHVSTTGALGLTRSLLLMAVFAACASLGAMGIDTVLAIWIDRTLSLIGSMCASLARSSPSPGGRSSPSPGLPLSPSRMMYSPSFALTRESSNNDLDARGEDGNGGNILLVRFLKLRVTQMERMVLADLNQIGVDDVVSDLEFDDDDETEVFRESSECSISGWEDLDGAGEWDSGDNSSSLEASPSWSSTDSSDPESEIEYRAQVRAIREGKKTRAHARALRRKRRRRVLRHLARVRAQEARAALGAGTYETVRIVFYPVDRVFSTLISWTLCWEGSGLTRVLVSGSPMDVAELLVVRELDLPEEHAGCETNVESLRRKLLLTHVLHMSSLELLEILVLRFSAPRPERVTREVEGRREVVREWTTDESVEFERQVARPTRDLIVSVVRQWAEIRPGDFRANTPARHLLNEFVGTLIPAAGMRAGARAILDALGMAGAREAARPPPGSAPVPRYDGLGVTVETADAIEVARQLTLVESALYRKVSAEQLVGLGWTKAAKDELSPDVMRVFDHFNAVGAWVQAAILEPVRVSGRAGRVEKFVAVAMELWAMGNFNGVLEIFGGLTSHAVKRLARTWRKVSDDAKENLDRIRTLASAAGSHKAYREELGNRSGQRAIPFLGVYLRDLVLTHEGNETWLEQDGASHINIRKCCMTADIVEAVLAWQVFIYPYARVDDIARLWDGDVLTEDELFARSLTVEPRIS